MARNRGKSGGVADLLRRFGLTAAPGRFSAVRGNPTGETQMANNPNDRKEQEKRQQEQSGTQRQDEQRQHQQDPNRQGQQNPADRQSQIDRDDKNAGQGSQQKR